MVSPEHRERAIEVGREILRLALEAQARGKIEGFEIFCDQGDPQIITSIVAIKPSTEH